MGGFANVLRRMTMASFAFGLAFVLPNVALAQAPKYPTTRLPWQTTSLFTKTAPFDDQWSRVVLDTQRMLRRLTHPYPMPQVVKLDANAHAATLRALWIPNVRAYTPPTPKPPTVDVSKVRATMAPFEYAQHIAAESRDLEGVLVGVQFEMLD